MAQETSLTSPGPLTPLPHHFLVVCSPHNQPYEQLLIGVGVGAVALGVVVWPWWWWWWLSYGPGAPAIHPTSSCSSALCWCQCWHWRCRWVVVVGPWVLVPPCHRRCHGILFGGVEHISVMWRMYEDCCVLTGRVSPFWGLPASLCAFLAHLDSLTSCLNREEGVWVSVGCVACFLWPAVVTISVQSKN